MNHFFETFSGNKNGDYLRKCSFFGYCNVATGYICKIYKTDGCNGAKGTLKSTGPIMIALFAVVIYLINQNVKWNSFESDF